MHHMSAATSPGIARAENIPNAATRSPHASFCTGQIAHVLTQTPPLALSCSTPPRAPSPRRRARAARPPRPARPAPSGSRPRTAAPTRRGRTAPPHAAPAAPWPAPAAAPAKYSCGALENCAAAAPRGGSACGGLPAAAALADAPRTRSASVAGTLDSGPGTEGGG